MVLAANGYCGCSMISAPGGDHVQVEKSQKYTHSIINSATDCDKHLIIQTQGRNRVKQ